MTLTVAAIILCTRDHDVDLVGGNAQFAPDERAPYDCDEQACGWIGRCPVALTRPAALQDKRFASIRPGFSGVAVLLASAIG
jgi:hypothetical protein